MALSLLSSVSRHAQAEVAEIVEHQVDVLIVLSGNYRWRATHAATPTHWFNGEDEKKSVKKVGNSRKRVEKRLGR